MKALTEVLTTEMNSTTKTMEINTHPVLTHDQTTQSPDYTEMMIEIQKIGDPVSFESLKDFYNIK